MYSKSGSIHYAESIFLKPPEKNSVTYTNMMLGYGLHGMGKKALALFYSLRENGLKLDVVTFVAILSACSYTGLVDEGLQIFELMDKEYGIQPSAEHYACVVDMLGRVGRLDEAHNFAKQLGEEVMSWEYGDHSLLPAESIEILNWEKLFPVSCLN